MGLDINLTGEKFFSGSRTIEDGFEVESHRLKIGHWRNLWAFDEYIHTDYGCGDRNINLDQENLECIIEVLKNVVIETISGEEVADLIEKFTKALEWLKTDEWNSVTYSSC